MKTTGIAQRITSFSISIVILGLLITLSVTGYVLYQQSYSQSHEHAHRQMDAMVKSLTEPLWSLDQSAIQALGEQFANDPNLYRLEVYYPEDSAPLFTLQRPSHNPHLMQLEQEIHYRDQHIGRINISLAPEDNRAAIQRYLLYAATLALTLAALMSLALRYSVHRELKQPLETLGAWAEQIARGHYDKSAEDIKENELQKLALQFSYMAHMIQEREEELQKLSSATEQSPACIMITGANERIDYANSAFEKVMGYGRAEIIGYPIRALYTESDKEVWNRARQQGRWQGEINATRKNGKQMVQWLIVKAQYHNDGRLKYFICAFTDITQAKLQQQRLEYLAHYDPLTNLPNRELLKARFDQATTSPQAQSGRLVVAFVDLDNFKQINDECGHDTGDKVLVEMADRLLSNIREGETAARLGGDEFILLLSNIKNEEHCELVLKAVQLTLAQPCTIEGRSFSIRSTIGASFCPLDHGDLDTMIRQADQTMYRAKLAGRNRIGIYNPDHDVQFTIQHESLRRLKQAMLQNELELYYQPQVNMVSGQVVGAEALIRWRHPERGILSPGEFLEAAYGTEMELLLGKWVMDAALQQLALLQKAGLEITISINISPRHLQSPHFLSELNELLRKHRKADASFLQLEVLESTSLSNANHVNQVLNLCQKQYGITAALDDFGTGYSSLTHLKDLPIKKIKIDRSFVRDMISDSNDHAIVQAIINLSDTFSVDVIAEGVETVEQGSLLIGMGCSIAQGYCISKPMPAAELIDWVNGYRPIAEWMPPAPVHRNVY